MIINLLIGGILIITGVFTKLFPDIMIAGYNRMPKEQKAKVNIKGLSWFMSICLVTIGLAVVGARFLFKNIGYS